jgi:hypothetical protein
MGSAIVSTPAVVSRNTVLDDIRAQEIESLKDRGFTSSRLEAIRESTSEMSPERLATIRSSPPVLSSDNPLPSEEQRKEPRSPVSPASLRLLKRSDSFGSKSTSTVQLALEAGERIPNSPVVVYKNSQGQNYSQRPSHKREDSHELLRRLARVTSSSPSPGRVSRPTIERQDSPLAPEPDQVSRDEEPTNGTSHPKPKQLGFVTANSSVNGLDSSEKENIAPRLVGQNSAAAASSDRQADITQIGEENVSTLSTMKTPRVIGAWVDTPGPATGRRTTLDALTGHSSRRPVSPRKQNSPKKASPVKALTRKALSGPSEPANANGSPKREPRLPSSALDAIVGRARSQDEEDGIADNLGDSTIDSLEDILAPSRDESAFELDEDTLLGLQIPKGTPRNEAERLRQREVLALHSMNVRLRATRTSIRDADRGLRRVEHELDKIDEASVSRKEHRHAHGECNRCGCPADGHYVSPWRTMWTAGTELFYCKNAEGQLRLTNVGWWSVLLCIWLVTELALW